MALGGTVWKYLTIERGYNSCQVVKYLNLKLSSVQVKIHDRRASSWYTEREWSFSGLLVCHACYFDQALCKYCFITEDDNSFNCCMYIYDLYTSLKSRSAGYRILLKPNGVRLSVKWAKHLKVKEAKIKAIRHKSSRLMTNLKLKRWLLDFNLNFII